MGVETLVDLHLADGLITAVEPSRPQPPEPSAPDASTSGVLDAAGRLMVAAFTESHLHLDKALLGHDPEASGLAGAIAATARRKATFTAADIRRRAGSVLAAALAAGTTAVRAQTEVDPGIGLLGVETIAEIADSVADVVRLQLTIFPQEGILARPGTLGLMRAALEIPGSVVGACPYAEPDVEAARRHVDLVLDLACHLDRCVDLHLDLAETADDPRFTLAEYVAGAVRARGLEGRVAISHASTLGVLDAERRTRTLDALAEARVTVVLLPATDLHLNGRRGLPVVRGLPVLSELWAHGVPVTVSSNNIQNAFTPTGRASLLDMALLLARVSHRSTLTDFERVLAMATDEPRRLLWPDAVAGVRAGARADLVLLDAADPAQAVIEDPARLAVISGGVVAAREERRIESLLQGSSG